jgi:hypothetical protein
MSRLIEVPEYELYAKRPRRSGTNRAECLGRSLPEGPKHSQPLGKVEDPARVARPRDFFSDVRRSG